jgi:hypothetical protein
MLVLSCSSSNTPYSHPAPMKKDDNPTKMVPAKK